MGRLHTGALATTLLALLLCPRGTPAASAGPQPGVAGVPEGGGFAAEMTCTGCHASRPLNPDALGAIELRGLPASYTPGESYRLTFALEHADSARLRWGFQLTAVAATSFRGAGELRAVDAETQTVSDPLTNRQYVGHTYASTAPGRPGGQAWTFEWQAPGSDVGDVLFFGAGNACNADGSQDGDWVFNPTPEPLARVFARSPTTEER
jgi:hypothetical protein